MKSSSMFQKKLCEESACPAGRLPRPPAPLTGVLCRCQLWALADTASWTRVDRPTHSGSVGRWPTASSSSSLCPSLEKWPLLGLRTGVAHGLGHLLSLTCYPEVLSGTMQFSPAV